MAAAIAKTRPGATLRTKARGPAVNATLILLRRVAGHREDYRQRCFVGVSLPLAPIETAALWASRRRAAAPVVIPVSPSDCFSAAAAASMAAIIAPRSPVS